MKLRISNTLIEMNFALAVALIKNPVTANTHHLTGLLYGCLDMKKISICTIQHVYREKFCG